MFGDDSLQKLIDVAQIYSLDDMDLNKGLQFYSLMDKNIKEKYFGTECKTVGDFITWRSGFNAGCNEAYEIDELTYNKYKHTGFTRLGVYPKNLDKGDVVGIIFTPSSDNDYWDSIPEELRNQLLMYKEQLINRKGRAGKYWYQSKTDRLSCIPNYVIHGNKKDINVYKLEKDVIPCNERVLMTHVNEDWLVIIDILKLKLTNKLYNLFSNAPKGPTGFILKTTQQLNNMRIPVTLTNKRNITDAGLASAFGFTENELEYLLTE